MKDFMIGLALGFLIGFFLAFAICYSTFESFEKTRNEILIEYGYAKYELDNRGNTVFIILEPEEKNHEI